MSTENTERIDELRTNLAHSLTHGSKPCAWCHNGLAGEDGFCSRMCRVESWRNHGDDSAFLSDAEAERLAWTEPVERVQEACANG